MYHMNESIKHFPGIMMMNNYTPESHSYMVHPEWSKLVTMALCDNTRHVYPKM